MKNLFLLALLPNKLKSKLIHELKIIGSGI